MIQLIVTTHILEIIKGQIKEVCRLIEPCLLIGTRECYVVYLTVDLMFDGALCGPVDILAALPAAVSFLSMNFA